MAWKIWAAFDRLLAADLDANMLALGGAPVGCIGSSAGVAGIVNVATKLPLSVGGPNLDTGDFLIPAGGAGVYHVSATLLTTAVSAALTAKLLVYRNGAAQAPSGRWEYVPVVGGGCHWTGYLALAVGDRLALYGLTSAGGVSMTAAGYLSAKRITDALV